MTDSMPRHYQNESTPQGASDSDVGFGVMLKRMERDAFEKWCLKNNIDVRKQIDTDHYMMNETRAAWDAWHARGALQRPCRGVRHDGCDYMAPCGSVCDKCGKAT